MTAPPTPGTASDNPSPATDGIRTYTRTELILGDIPVVQLPEHETTTRFVRTSFELNVIDGWTKIREWTDDSGLVWAGTSTTPSTVRAVLDAARQHAEFIARAHLAWIARLDNADRHHQAGAQRRALDSALRRHGLVVNHPRPPRKRHRVRASRSRSSDLTDTGQLALPTPE